MLQFLMLPIFFSLMEEMGILDFVSKSLVQEACARFQRSWNYHPLRTEGNRSPNQLFIAGLTNLRNQGSEFTELEQVNGKKKLLNNLDLKYHLLFK